MTVRLRDDVGQYSSEKTTGRPQCRQAPFGTSVNCRSPVSCGSPLTSRLGKSLRLFQRSVSAAAQASQRVTLPLLPERER